MTKRIYTEDPNELIKLAEEGYRITSRKYNGVSKVDREDWKEWMGKNHSPWDEKEGLRWVNGMNHLSAIDHYRRCHAKTYMEITTSLNISKYIPNSGSKV